MDAYEAIITKRDTREYDGRPVASRSHSAASAAASTGSTSLSRIVPASQPQT